MRFEFATAGRIVFGPGVVADLPSVVQSFGTAALVVTGHDPGRWAAVIDALRSAGVTCDHWATSGEPTVRSVTDGVARWRACDARVVVAIGGGSVIDAGKAMAALATNDGDVVDYLEIVGKGRPLIRAPLPFIAVPTTAGTGSEVTRNAVLGVPERGIKVSLRSPLMLPCVALVDPDLSIDLPPSLTASTGLDALTQLIEPYVSSKANPLVDGLCVTGMARAAGALRLVYRNGGNRAAREEMAVASLLSGLALANAGLGAVHGFAAPIGGRFDAPHGAVCASLLPHVCAANLRALAQRDPTHPARARYDHVARLLTGRPDATADDGVAWLHGVVTELEIPRLREYGVGVSDVSTLVEQASRASSMKGNPIVLSPDELGDLLEAAI
ncbi:MAG: iron-containing alcohol dehydrogenase [Acidobacteriota bacterium]